jgi:hypothetical protein
MTPKETLKQIHDLTGAVIEIGLSEEQNYSSTHGDTTGTFEISVATASAMSVALKNVSYRDVYQELEKARCFNIKMLDGGLISLRYRFSDGVVTGHSLSYFPSPDLEHFQNDPELYLEDEAYADAIAGNIVPFPVRFDYSSDVAKFVEVDHPFSHMTLGQYKNCRIPVCSPLGPLTFGGFIFRSFYNTAFRKYSEQIPVSDVWFPKSITNNERRVPHLVCSP